MCINKMCISKGRGNVPRPYRFRYVTDTSPKGESVEQLQKKSETYVPLLMFSQRNNPYCVLLSICAAKVVVLFELCK